MSRFLADPALFPARFAGEPFGERRATLDLPGGPYALTGLSAEQASSVGGRLRPIEGHAAFEVAIFRAAESDFLPVDTRGWEYELDIDGESIAGLNLMARLGAGRAAIWTTAAAGEAFAGVVENVLRPLVARRLLGAGGLLVHGASLVMDGRGYLCAGRSGAGKSTISRLALEAGQEVLSDDLSAVSGGTLIPIPFSGDVPVSALRTVAAPLQGIVELRKGTMDELQPLSRGEAVALLVRCAPYVNRDEALSDLLLQRATDIVASTRTAVLTFRREGEVCPILAEL